MSKVIDRFQEICPRPNCKRFRKPGHFACAQCWFSLPEAIRIEIWSAWSLYRSDLNALPQLRDAQQAAIDFWNRQEVQPS